MLVQIDPSTPLEHSSDPLIQQTLNSDGYVETFRASDLRPGKNKALIYSRRMHHPDTGAVVGLLPVYFQFLGPAGAPLSLGWIGLEAAYVVGVALLMASRVPHFSGKSIGPAPREYVAPVLIAVAAGLLLIVNYPLQSLIALSLLYLATIPFAIRKFRRSRAQNA